MKISAVSAEPWSIELSEPFGIATGVQARADNVLVRVRLDDGTEGLGEAAPFPAVNGETQADALRDLAGAEAFVGEDARRLSHLVLPGTASARCGFEMALLDAVLRRVKLPMWAWFGGAGTSLEIDHTITTSGDPGPAAARIAAAGYRQIKMKVGHPDDRARLAEVTRAAPGCQLILDGNQGLENADATLALITERTVLLEQPLAKSAIEEQRRLKRLTRVPIAADESVSSIEDLRWIAGERLFDVVNLKAMKSGLFAIHEMALVARGLGLGLMIGAMVESPLGLSAAAALAAGIGGFSFCDLDTHLFMPRTPTQGGFQQSGPRLDVSEVAAGHGVSVPR